MKHQLAYFLTILFLVAACGRKKDNYEATLPSPDFDIHLYFSLFKGNPYYMVYHGKEKVLAWSALGFYAEGGREMKGGMVLADEFGGDDADSKQEKEPTAFFSDLKYNSLTVPLRSKTSADMAFAIEFRTFNTGIAYRYRFESTASLQRLAVREASEFNFDTALGAWTINENTHTTLQNPGGGIMVPAILSFAGGKLVTIMAEEGRGGTGLLG